MKNNNSSGGGMGFAGVLATVFIVLKLCHVIEWSWLWVLSPIWIELLIFIAIYIWISMKY